MSFPAGFRRNVFIASSPILRMGGRSKGRKARPEKAKPAAQPKTGVRPAPAGGKAVGGQHRFVILKNYPESQQFEVVKRNKGFLASILERLGLEKKD